MDNKDSYHLILASIYRNIKYYKDMIISSRNLDQRMFYEIQLYNERIRLNYWKNSYHYYINNQETNLNLHEQRVFTVEELSQYDGSNGKPAYVAVNDIVYDVSLEATWGGGTHFSLYAGKDLTAQFNGCHGGMLEVLKNLPKVGILEK